MVSICFRQVLRRILRHIFFRSGRRSGGHPFSQRRNFRIRWVANRIVVLQVRRRHLARLDFLDNQAFVGLAGHQRRARFAARQSRLLRSKIQAATLLAFAVADNTARLKDRKHITLGDKLQAELAGFARGACIDPSPDHLDFTLGEFRVPRRHGAGNNPLH